MSKTTLMAILFAGCMYQSYAQTEPAQDVKKEQVFDHTVGVQLNGLIKQVFNFNNSSGTAVNPYLLTYSMDSRKSGWGLRLGAGYNYSSTASNDGITETSTNINDLQLRVGGERAFKLSDKWSTGVGIDFVYNSNNDKTSNTIHQFDTTTTVTKTTIASYGGGAMGWLRYNISEKIQVGTEASFYYVTGKQKNVIDVTTSSSFGGGISTTETTTKPTVSQGSFTSPIVFFLLVRF